jgi:hypothetical protein
MAKEVVVVVVGEDLEQTILLLAVLTFPIAKLTKRLASAVLTNWRRLIHWRKIPS